MSNNRGTVPPMTPKTLITYIIAIIAIGYRLVEGISRKIVRLKKYEDNIYSSEEYQHFAVIQVRLPQSGKMQEIEIELNEFQVQMAIDNLQLYKLGEVIMKED